MLGVQQPFLLALQRGRDGWHVAADRQGSGHAVLVAGLQRHPRRHAVQDAVQEGQEPRQHRGRGQLPPRQHGLVRPVHGFDHR